MLLVVCNSIPLIFGCPSHRWINMSVDRGHPLWTCVPHVFLRPGIKKGEEANTGNGILDTVVKAEM